MTPGVDSYVSLNEANVYAIAAQPDSRWHSLTSEQREQRLLLACEQLEALPFSGRKTRAEQALSFPRAPYAVVPQSIKAAQVEIALLPLRQGGEAAEAAQREALQRQGVTSFSIGDLSESYGARQGLVSVHAFLADSAIHGLLARFMQGGYAVC